jgi:hypothetical protein
MTTPFFPSWRCFLSPLGTRLKHTADSFSRATLSNIEQTLRPALPPGLLDKPARGGHSRRRVFCLGRTFWCWIWQIFQGNTSCRQVVRQMQALLRLLEQPPIDEDCSAYCQARKNLSLGLLEKAFGASAGSALKEAPQWALLQARPIKLVDASSVRLEDTPENRAAFPPSQNQFSKPSFPILKFLALFSLASGSLLARATGTLQVAETRLLMSLRQHLQPGDILAGDRAYGLYVMLHWVGSLGADLVARLNARTRRVDFRKALKKLGPCDSLFLWSKPKVPSKLMSPQEWAQVPETMVVRIMEVRIERPGFRTRELTLVTTLVEARLYPAQELIEVYFKRWRLEMCLDDLKTTLGMEKLNCRTPELALKELLIYLIAHNFIRWIMCQAAAAGEVNLERISFTGTLDAFRQWSVALVQVRGPGKSAKQKRLWQELLQVIAADLVPKRPGRKEPRAVKRTSKYPPLTRPRHIYVDRWSRNKKRRVQRAKMRALLN